MARVLMVASEAAPFAKTGGLADVLGALPSALLPHGNDVAVVLPRYSSIPLEQMNRVWDHLPVWVAGRTFHCAVYELQQRGVVHYFIDCPALYGRPGIYSADGKDFPDNHLRFGVLSEASLGVARFLFRPDVLHLHDWQAALAATLLRTKYHLDPTFLNLRVVFTIHNLEHQGRFARIEFDELGLESRLFTPEYLEFYGDLNLLKGGILFSDAITTVSTRYAQEIQTPEFGFGLDGLLRAHGGRLTGILNGADYEEWSPERDAHIAANYSADDLDGKRICKQDLLREFGLPGENMDRPVLGIVSRLARQKGFDLLAEIAGDMLKDDLCLVVLGSGESQYEDLFRNLALEFPGRVGEHLGYNNRLAHKIEAGADVFLMPSLFEPCGLNQIYSLRYGTIPVVRATGGLDDTVDEITGFKFPGKDPLKFLEKVRAAVTEWRDGERWRQRMRTAMARDFSWNRSAGLYSELYKGLLS